MEKTKKIWMDGKFIDWDEAQTHVLTHSLHYGTGVFEGIRFYRTDKGPAVFRLGEHVERLLRSASDLHMEIPFTRAEFARAILDTVRINGIDDGYIRPLVYFGPESLSLHTHGVSVHSAIAVWPWGLLLGDEAIKVKISKYIRIHPDSTHTGSKICGHYINSVLATMDARSSGYDEALLLDYRGNVAEGAGENVFIVEGGTLVTPKPGTILLGITRDAIMQIASDMSLEVREEDISPERLKKADEIFFTGTAAEVASICRVDQQIVGDGKPGQLTEMLQKKYRDIVHGRVDKYLGWLSLVPRTKIETERSVFQSWISSPMFSFLEE